MTEPTSLPSSSKDSHRKRSEPSSDPEGDQVSVATALLNVCRIYVARLIVMYTVRQKKRKRFL